MERCRRQSTLGQPLPPEAGIVPEGGSATASILATFQLRAEPLGAVPPSFQVGRSAAAVSARPSGLGPEGVPSTFRVAAGASRGTPATFALARATTADASSTSASFMLAGRPEVVRGAQEDSPKRVVVTIHLEP